MSEGSILVVGTNGKTTVTNMLADALERAGCSVVCNRTGANLDSGVATALLHTKPVQWGVFECDELWLAKILPFTQSRYVVLLNLFRDQLDRSGEIDHIQQSIAKALSTSPHTTLVYNADDPLCQAIANKVENTAIPFGIAEDMGLKQNIVADARMCQECSSLLEYDYRQYGQLGSYHCPSCDFGRAELVCAAAKVRLGQECQQSKGMSYEALLVNQTGTVEVPFSGAYMVYNTLAVCVAADLAGVPLQVAVDAMREFDPKNGRLQEYRINGMPVLLNLAKNPTGFNQNLKLVTAHEGPAAVALFVNDKEADGHDVSWLWDIDFEELAAVPGLVAYAGGLRGPDVQVVLKYAGVNAQLVDDANEVLRRVHADSPQAQAFFIANYTALPGVKAQLDEAAKQETQVAGTSAGYVQADIEGTIARAEGAQGEVAQGEGAQVQGAAADDAGGAPAQAADAEVAGPPVAEAAVEVAVADAPAVTQEAMRPLVIAHLFPTLLNLYGDNGNVRVLAQRAKWRGIPVEVQRIEDANEADLSQADIVFIGGGPDREQHEAQAGLSRLREQLVSYVNGNGPLLAICGGYQIIGSEWLMGNESVPGLSLVDLTTKRAEGGSHNRLVGNIVLQSPLAQTPVVGFENHAGRTYLGEGLQPFGTVVGSHGSGNNDNDHADGVRYKNLIGSYLHGPLLAKNPEIADALLTWALERRVEVARDAAAGEAADPEAAAPEAPAPEAAAPEAAFLPLSKLNDEAELRANKNMRSRLGAK